jgi:hypothetical protein
MDATLQQYPQKARKHVTTELCTFSDGTGSGLHFAVMQD